VQEEGPTFPSPFSTLRLSRVFKPDDRSLDDDIPTRRIVLWVFVWIGIFVGLFLYFKYARLLTPMLG
jgi:hypothetical protein